LRPVYLSKSDDWLFAGDILIVAQEAIPNRACAVGGGQSALGISANTARLHFEMTRPLMTVSESCRRVMQFPGEVCGTAAGNRDDEKCPHTRHSQYPKGSAGWVIRRTSGCGIRA
jgi:hypothetical protein